MTKENYFESNDVTPKIRKGMMIIPDPKIENEHRRVGLITGKVYKVARLIMNSGYGGGYGVCIEGCDVKTFGVHWFVLAKETNIIKLLDAVDKM